MSTLRRDYSVPEKLLCNAPIINWFIDKISNVIRRGTTVNLTLRILRLLDMSWKFKSFSEGFAMDINIVPIFCWFTLMKSWTPWMVTSIKKDMWKINFSEYKPIQSPIDKVAIVPIWANRNWWTFLWFWFKILVHGKGQSIKFFQLKSPNHRNIF